MKTILIVGGSKGIGAAISEKLADTHHIINLSRTKPESSNSNIKHYDYDATLDEAQLPELESLDSIVYCPGSINLKPVKRLKLNDFRDDFNINVVGAVKVIQHYLPILKNGTNPSITLFSTVAAKLGMPFHASVAASKSAVEGLTKSLGAEFAPTIRVNAIAPTVTNTDLAGKLLRNEKMVEGMKERHPMKTFLEPNDVAEMATFLISDKAKTITGQVFNMDCGIVSFKL